RCRLSRIWRCRTRVRGGTRTRATSTCWPRCSRTRRAGCSSTPCASRPRRQPSGTRQHRSRGEMNAAAAFGRAAAGRRHVAPSTSRGSWARQ
ncbi:unnamed protein product, partial [Prorocentrum cordatum]